MSSQSRTGAQKCAGAPSHAGTKVSVLSLMGLGSNPRDRMDVCKCIAPSRYGGTLNSRRAASPLVRLVEGEEVLEAP
ncbi:hypothetical protein TNCV_423081 [Trichonephila clavipes]|nr:hypothetical protein TNCV_423081 [Trichonephila clavipes]